MSLQNYKNQNHGFKTLNLDGVLFLVNDSSDELGQHYENKILTSPKLISDRLLSRHENFAKMGIKYIFVIVPDKSVAMEKYLVKYSGFNKCHRSHVDELSHLPFVVDTLKTIFDLCHQYVSQPSIPDDSHLNMLSIYGVYLAIMKKLGITPRNFVIDWIPSDQFPMGLRDLLYACNNGTRSVPNAQKWYLPIVKQKQNNQLKNYQIDFRSDEHLNLDGNEKVLNTYRGYIIDVYENPTCENDLKVFIYHDSHIAMPYDGKSLRKEWFAEHFRTCYFLWSPFDQIPLNKYDVNIIIDITTERFLNTYRLSIFDEYYYLNRYPDVRSLIENGEIESARHHYELYGINERRFPNKKFESECCCNSEPQKIYIPNNDFFYRKKYVVVDRFVNEFPIITPFKFYNLYGHKMGHEYNQIPNDQSYLSIFDEKYYLNKYSDIRNAVESGLISSGLEHYRSTGIYEGRWPNIDFEPTSYQH